MPSPSQRKHRRQKRKDRQSGSTSDCDRKQKQPKISTYVTESNTSYNPEDNLTAISDDIIESKEQYDLRESEETVMSESEKMKTSNSAISTGPVAAQKNETQGVTIDHINVIMQRLEGLDSIQREIKSLHQDIKEVKKSLEFSDQKLEIIVKEHEALKTDNTQLQGKVKSLEYQNRYLSSKVNQLEDYSRKNNIRISGIEEKRGEDCFKEINNLFEKIGCMEIYLERCHRTGKREDGKNRDIIARFSYFPDKILVMKHRKSLPAGVFINDDYCVATQRKINTLRPVLKVARQTDDSTKLIGDKLVYKKKTYSTDNIMSIPINLTELSTKENDHVVAFAGRYSPLSNLFPYTFTVEDQEYKSNEHYYQHQKCKAAGRDEIAAMVLMEPDPEGAMSVGKQVTMSAEWITTSSKNIMKKGIKSKFSSPNMKNILVKTGQKIIAEGTRHPLWGVGLPFTSQDLLNQGYWTGNNFLGELLCQVRTELAG